MIQRIQSLYLFGAAALLVLFVVLAPAWVAGVAEAAAWLGPAAYGLAVLTAVVALVAIGLYKSRDRQRSLVGVAQWLDLALVLVVLVGLYVSTTEAEAGTTARYLTAVLPVVAYVLLRLAHVRVRRDIELVRSMDRLR